MELERACVQGVPDIQEAAAAGVPSPGGGPEQLMLFVVPRNAGAASRNPKIKAQCQAAIRAKLNPLFKVDRVSSSLPSLPPTCFAAFAFPDMLRALEGCAGIYDLLLATYTGIFITWELECGSVSWKDNDRLCMRQVIWRDSLPRTASNKVMRRLLRDEVKGHAKL